MRFYGRRRELAILDEAYQRPEGQMFVLYGRRGVGKTVLLGHWLERRKYRHLFWTADQRSAPVLLRSLSQAIAAFIEPGRALPAEFTYRSWELAFDEIARLAQPERLVVVLDEFTYLMAADPSLPSILQRVWDHKLKRSNLLLVITGSHAGMIERQVLSYRAPLYHRANASLHRQTTCRAHRRPRLGRGPGRRGRRQPRRRAGGFGYRSARPVQRARRRRGLSRVARRPGD